MCTPSPLSHCPCNLRRGVDTKSRNCQQSTYSLRLQIGSLETKWSWSFRILGPYSGTNAITILCARHTCRPLHSPKNAVAILLRTAYRPSVTWLLIFSTTRLRYARWQKLVECSFCFYIKRPPGLSHASSLLFQNGSCTEWFKQPINFHITQASIIRLRRAELGMVMGKCCLDCLRNGA